MRFAWLLALLHAAVLCRGSCEGNLTCDEPSLVQLSGELSAGRRRRSRRRRRSPPRRRSSDDSRRRRRASTYTGTLPYVLQAYCSSGSWLTACDDIPSGWQQHNGAFDPSLSTAPPKATGSAKDNYLTLGGSGVDGTVPSASTIESWMSTYNSDNLDFDLEGTLKNDFKTAASLTASIQEKKSSAKSQVTALVSQYSTAATYKNKFDYFAIMIHGNSMTSGNYGIPKSDPTSGGTWTYIQNWLDSDVPNSKIILSLTTVNLEAYMVDWFKELIAEYGLAGMGFFYWNQLDSSISITCIEDQATQCDTTDSFGCSATCVGGDADGQCCDSADTTTVGSCSSLGQEGCCGGTDATTYCQKV